MNELRTAIATSVKDKLLDVARSRAAEKRTGPEKLKAKLEERFKDKLTAMGEWSDEIRKRHEEYTQEFLRFREVVAKSAHGTGFEARPMEVISRDGSRSLQVEVYPGCQTVGADVRRELKLLAKELGLEALLKDAE